MIECSSLLHNIMSCSQLELQSNPDIYLLKFSIKEEKSSNYKSLLLLSVLGNVQFIFLTSDPNFPLAK